MYAQTARRSASETIRALTAHRNPRSDHETSTLAA